MSVTVNNPALPPKAPGVTNTLVQTFDAGALPSRSLTNLINAAAKGVARGRTYDLLAALAKPEGLLAPMEVRVGSWWDYSVLFSPLLDTPPLREATSQLFTLGDTRWAIYCANAPEPTNQWESKPSVETKSHLDLAGQWPRRGTPRLTLYGWKGKPAHLIDAASRIFGEVEAIAKDRAKLADFVRSVPRITVETPR